MSVFVAEPTTPRPSRRARLSEASRVTFRSLRIRNFRLFFIGQLVSQVGTWATNVALTLLVLRLTGSGLAVGLLVACEFGPMLLLGAWTGLIADRSDKRRLLLTTQALLMVQSFALAALAFAPVPSLGWLYAAALAGGVMLAFDNPSRRSFVPEMVPSDHMQNAVMLNTALMTSSRVLGPALAGLLVVTVGFGWCFALDGLSYVAVLIALYRMRTDELTRPPVTVRGRGQVRAGLRYVRNVPDLWVPLAMMAVIGTLTFNFAVLIPLFVKQTLGGSDGTFTLVFSVLSMGSVVAALAAAHRSAVDVRQVVLAAAGFGAAMLAFAGAPNLAIAFPLAFLVGLASVAFITTNTAIVQIRADPSMRGRVLALQAMVLLGSTPLGGPLLGAVSDQFGARAGLALGGVAALATAGWGYLTQRRVLDRTVPIPPLAREPADLDAA